MSDQRTPNQAKVEPTLLSDRLIAEGIVVPFEQLKWTDFPLENRLRALRVILNEIARDSLEEVVDKNEEPQAQMETRATARRIVRNATKKGSPK